MHQPPTAPIAPRRARLADGREILYFDDAPGAGPPPLDPRQLAPRAAPAELRQDALLDEWVIVASHRQARTFLPGAGDCPLCPSTDATHTEIPAHDYDVVVFENRFPSLPALGTDGTAAGRCEVICFASAHSASVAGLDDRRLGTIAPAWVQRSEALRAEPGIAHVFPFENRGEQIGVTLHHPHGQIYAYPFVPPRMERMIAVATEHRARTAGCLACDLLAEELADGRRIVLADEAVVAYVPAAARWPYEVHLVPRRHVPDLAALSPEELSAMVRAQADLLGRLDRLFDRPVPYMAGWLQAPTRAERDVWHLRLQIVSPQRDAGKLKYLAGSEALMGAFINDVRPEEAAQRLRDLPGRDQHA